MSVTSRRVVLTGIGVVNPLGEGVRAYWDGLSRGAAGVRPIQRFECASLPTRFAGQVPDFDTKKYIAKENRKSLRVMARAIQMAVAAAQLALDDAKIDKERLDPTRFGVEFGAGLLPSDPEELGVASQKSIDGHPGTVDLQCWGEQGLPNIAPLWMLKYLPNMLACHVSILHNAQGPSNSITESDVASLLALGEAYRIIGRNQADVFITGGADSKVGPLTMTRHCLFGSLSRRNDAPEKACRPFDLGRDGVVIGEGAGVMIVEELEHARQRGARVHAEVIGFGAAFDRSRSGRGVRQAMVTALREAGITPDDVDHVNAHATGSVANDPWEARAIQEVFAGCKRPVPVFAAKGYFGNLGAGSDLSELAISLLALSHGQLPRSLNYEVPDPACPVRVNREPIPVTKPYVLKLGLTELGQCAAVVCRKWE